MSAVTTDSLGNSLIVGFNDGIVKVYYQEAHSYGSQEPESDLKFTVREQINAFTNVEGKKRPVTKLMCHSPCGGALYACSNSGVIKLLRLHL